MSGEFELWGLMRSPEKTIPGKSELRRALGRLEEACGTRIHSLTYRWGEGDPSLGMEFRSDSKDLLESPQPLEECFQAVQGDAEYPFLLYRPPCNTGENGFPTILFLHGIGERGKEPFVLADYGPFRYIRRGHALPFMVIAPVLEAEDHWVENSRKEETDRQMIRLERFLAQMRYSYPIDPDRILLTGLSMGGRGAYKLACHLPDTFAAAAICCGRAAPREHPDCPHYDLSRLKIPCWIFHGLEDSIVDPEQALAAARHLRRIHPDGPLGLTLYPHVGHSCYDFTYQDAGLYAWFEEQRRENRVRSRPPKRHSFI